MKTTEEARTLAELLVRLSEDLGIDASALITDMHNPLGSAVGNALEVRESVLLLKNEPVPDDLARKVNHVATRLLKLKGISNPEHAVENAPPRVRPTRSSWRSSVPRAATQTPWNTFPSPPRSPKSSPREPAT